MTVLVPTNAPFAVFEKEDRAFDVARNVLATLHPADYNSWRILPTMGGFKVLMVPHPHASKLPFYVEATHIEAAGG